MALGPVFEYQIGFGQTHAKLRLASGHTITNAGWVMLVPMHATEQVTCIGAYQTQQDLVTVCPASSDTSPGLLSLISAYALLGLLTWA